MFQNQLAQIIGQSDPFIGFALINIETLINFLPIDDVEPIDYIVKRILDGISDKLIL